MFHLGVLRFLKQTGCLSRVCKICAVSGGSITAGYLVRYWTEFEKGNDEQFAKTAYDLIDGAGRSGIREQIPLSPLNPTRRFAGLEKCYVKRLSERKNRRPALKDILQAPDFHILATDFATGRLVGFSREGIAIYESDGNGKLRVVKPPTEGSDFGLWRAVACSSAFPPLFAPEVISPEEYWEGSGKNLVVGDGGVYDNLGIGLLDHLATTEAKSVLFVVSDAGRPFETGPASESTFKWIIDRNTRANDIGFYRLAEADMRTVKPRMNVGNRRVLIVRIGETIPDPDGTDLSKAVQDLVGQVRTDLDSFSTQEIYALIRHGWGMTRRKWGEAGELPRVVVESMNWLPFPQKKITDDKLVKGLKKSSARKWRVWFWPVFWFAGKVCLFVAIATLLWIYWKPLYRLIVPAKPITQSFSTREKTINDFVPPSAIFRGFREGLPQESQDFMIDFVVPVNVKAITLATSSDQKPVPILRSWGFTDRRPANGKLEFHWTENKRGSEFSQSGQWKKDVPIRIIFCVTDATVERLTATVTFTEE